MQLLDHLFRPRAIAVVGAGATSTSMGSRLVKNILDYGFTGRIYPVNRDGEACNGIAGYRRIVDIDGPVDVAFVAVAAKLAPQILADCAQHGVAVAQIFSSTYGEGGDLNARILEAARGVTRVIGPNCLGTHSPGGHVTYVPGPDDRIGSAAIVSQSGGLTTDIIHQSRMRGLRLAKAVSIGDCIDLGPADFLAYLGGDEETSAIGFYLEGTSDARFARLLRDVGARKPIVVLKGGRTEQGAAAAASHTGALAGDYATWEAAIEQSGGITVNDVDDLLATLTAFQRNAVAPRGGRVAMIGNGGGITVLTTDVLADEGLSAAQLARETLERISACGLPPGSSLGSALDVPANALTRMPPESVRGLFAAMIADPNVDLMIAHFNLVAFALYPGGEALARDVAAILATFDRHGKPVYVALRGSPDERIERYRQTMLAACEAAQLPCFADAIEAAHVAARAWRREQFVASRARSSVAALSSAMEAACRDVLTAARGANRAMLTQIEAFALLDALGIAHPPLKAAATPDEACAAAEAMGFPVAVKIDSPDVVHKTESGGVRLNLATREAVAQAFADVVGARQAGVVVQRMATPPVVETIVGITRDPRFGAVVLAGVGGILVEVLRDVALRIAPVSIEEARGMWQQLRARKLFEGFRGAKPADAHAFESAIARLSLAAAAFDEIAELDVNPLFVYEDGAWAVDCRVRLM
jgi:acyl-CoA synthetase (NDP forming)